MIMRGVTQKLKQSKLEYAHSSWLGSVRWQHSRLVRGGEGEMHTRSKRQDNKVCLRG